MKKKVFVLLTVLLCLVCLLVLAFHFLFNDRCQHRDADDDNKCDKCGVTFADGTDVTPPEHTHEWGAWSVTTPATCQAKGVETRTCACGEDETRDVEKDMNNHAAWGSWSVTTPATCQTKGVETRTCACGHSETRDVEKDMNNHAAWSGWGVTTPATCQAKGVETRTCACGHSETRDVEKDMSNHVAWGAWIETKAPSATSVGEETRTCACGTSETRDVIYNHTHEWGAWSITTPATCQAKGVETHSCACGHSETRDIEKDMNNHVAWGSWSVTTPATCQAKGVETRTCACGHSETRDIGKDMDNHVAWGAWFVTTPATCQAKGVETHTCACGHSETRDIEKDMDNHVAWGAWSVTTPATCVDKGEEKRTCACGAYETREVDATGEHIFVSGVCTVCGETTDTADEPLYTVDPDDPTKIYFGEYPQTLKADNVSITSTTDSRGYFLGTDECYYAKITANPRYSSYTFSNGSTVAGGTVYYFKVEPIRWRILSQSNGTALILCDSIIANKAFDGSWNNYAESDIRAWLNDQFYNTAFTALEQELILTTTVDNSVASTGDSSNPNACENTNDKVFLLSYAEVTNSAYGFSTSDSTYNTARRMQTSDYSRATGAHMNTSTDYYGNGWWWLRSPLYYYSRGASGVDCNGRINDGSVDNTYGGVVPALQIRLSAEPDDPLYTVDPDDPTKIYFGEYPQTIKADNVSITSTTDSRGYYLGSDGAYYAKVTADPYDSGYTFSDNSAVTDGTVYYFKVEPIRWRILSQEGGTALILCDSIIANKAYQSDYSQSSNGECYTTANGAPNGTYANNYQYSEVRAWLNAEFYNTAFTELERELILTTTVDNSVASTGYSSNPYACENTNDKVFLLSYAEVTNSAYGFSTSTSRQMQTSDYSRAAGAYTNTFTDYYGNGDWWLRSPSYNYSYGARSVYDDGSIYGSGVYYTGYGVVPALQIRLQ